ncbi:MAG: hypothetical protein ACQESE_03795 [Nanobdellota archaeon]
MDHEHKRRIDIFESVSAIYLTCIFALTILVAGVGGHQLFLVLVGFFPTILTVIISLVIHEEFATQKKTLWFIPLLLLLVFYLLGSGNVPLLQEFDIEVLTGLNFLLAMLYVLMVFGILKRTNAHKPHDIRKQMPPKQERPQTIAEYISSIEDKSKAINFAIGRIYGKYHGGSKELREKIRVPPEWYNEFSSIGISSETVDYTQLSEIIGKFENHFKTFEKSERDVFGKEADNLKDLIRDPKGKDRIIDVIEHNDKDPVKSYFEGAKEFCKRLRAELGHRELSIVKNEYKGEEGTESKHISTQKTIHHKPHHPNQQIVHRSQNTEQPSEHKSQSPDQQTSDHSTSNTDKEPSGPAPGIPEKHP